MCCYLQLEYMLGVGQNIRNTAVAVIVLFWKCLAEMIAQYYFYLNAMLAVAVPSCGHKEELQQHKCG